MTADVDWSGLARRARLGRILRRTGLTTLLALASLPIVLTYLWMVAISFSARTGGVSGSVLWIAVGALAPAIVLYSIVHLTVASTRLRVLAAFGLTAAAAALLWTLIGDSLHLDNYRFLWRRNFLEDLKGQATVGGQFPSVWTAFVNSLLLASTQTALVLTAATLAGYYLSRFAFPGRATYLQGLLILHAFPALTLIIPIFLLLHWIGLLDTLTGVVLVVSALELPFFIFVMKGFFDAVPWEIEMSALTDGATRRQAFFYVVLPQVRPGLIAVGVFAFIRGWEDYVFVRFLLIENSNWVMSLYLFFVSEDVMGVDYGIVAAVATFYILPALILYLVFQRYVTQMSFGGVKG